jgi:hypothetical protein
MPIPSDKEAIAGAKRLYRRAMGRPFRGKVVATSGNRYTWIRRGVMHVNPNRRWGHPQPGWPDIVHLLAHYCHSRRRPNDRPHSRHELDLEGDLTRYVVKHGFHEGKLLRPVKPAKPKPDRQTVAYQRSVAALKRWNTKMKRAQTGVRAYQTKVRRYEKVLAIR